MQSSPSSSPTLSPAALAAMIDHTFLKPDGAPDAVARLCEEAARYHFACAMVNPAEVRNAYFALRGSGVKVGTVIGFPLGQCTAAAMCFEAADAIGNGAEELDFVINVRRLKAAALEGADREGGARAALLADLTRCASEPRRLLKGVVTKLIIETCYLTDDEKVLACQLAKEAGFDFVKTSTGFGTAGATVADVALMRATVGPEMGVKAAGGIRDLQTALALVAAGATRLGCSAGVKIVEELAKANG